MAPAIPPSMERPHFIGIGGAGMSGIAKILAQRGARVAGSDAKGSPVTEALESLGATVRIGHAAEHLAPDATCVVVSSAIREDNPELVAAAERGVAVVHRSDALAALMDGTRALAIAGTHGKTTTTSMLAVGLRTLGLDPSFAIGGDLDEPGSNAHQGAGDLFVAEADESDRSFHRYAPRVAVVLNAELDHHANYASMEEIHESFEIFVDRIEPGGTLVVNADQEGARELTARVRARSDVAVLTYGESEQADVRVLSVRPRGLSSEVVVRFGGAAADLADGDVHLAVSVPGRHYAHNAVAALTVAAAAGVPVAELAPALASYTGVKRRLQLKGEAAGVQVIDSYAHHPTEMTADLEAIRGALGADGAEIVDGAGGADGAAGAAGEKGRVLVVFQPHLFSRTQELGTEMGAALALADASLVLEIYPAREDPIPGVTSELIIDAARQAGADVQAVDGAEQIPQVLAGMVKPGDLVLTMGAGDVTDLGPRILTRLAASEEGER
ncbi:UDP-N-acetylmuramate--L-alanine ligase [Streptomyces sp. XM4193]|uniref:UDP-N-acetylmuramate--L-alanine ligase n=1 Tax=Streptomyces sp. XM4193 TaxID=2929782 RepID=UPI001FF700AC|nr:UDP-N-acetylmuramate--L-alanine ligase [Streptomyces sp. XM4193]MCK1797100.1 UDP-N-acetylmuramate--L-alanine ligase [Streptomyces sp. XM4193]